MCHVSLRALVPIAYQLILYASTIQAMSPENRHGNETVILTLSQKRDAIAWNTHNWQRWFQTSIRSVFIGMEALYQMKRSNIDDARDYSNCNETNGAYTYHNQQRSWQRAHSEKRLFVPAETPSAKWNGTGYLFRRNVGHAIREYDEADCNHVVIIVALRYWFDGI